MPTRADDLRAAARIAGLALDANGAERIEGAIGPALAVFREIEGTLAMEREPADFLSVQTSRGVGR